MRARDAVPSCSRERRGGDAEVLSIFFPMWNEELYVERAVDAAKRVCDTMVADGVIADYELLIVDDASTDRTPELADKLAAADPHVRVIHHERNRKLGGAIKTGFANARGDLVLYSDADLPFDMEEVPRAIRLMREYEVDIVSAYRFDRTGEGYTRAIYTFFYNVLIRTMFGVKARDINFAFKLCRRRGVRAHPSCRARARSSTPSWSSGPPGSATTSSSSASTTSPAPGASRRSAGPASSSRSCARWSSSGAI